MALAGIKWEDMPTLPIYLDMEAGNKLCYNFVLGQCTGRYCTHKAGHASVDDITQDFATAICTLLQPGIDSMTSALHTAVWQEFKNVIAAKAGHKRQREA